MIEVKELTKYYGVKPGVSHISFTINKGETVGLLGPNGAGKTTVMKMLAGQMIPSSGSISINGIDAIKCPKEAAACVGFMPEIPPLYIEMDVAEYLGFVSNIKGVPAKKKSSHINEIMEMVAIDHVSTRLIKNLSKGYRQRVGLAQALIGFPDVLILDEPTVGLDPKQIAEVRKLIENLSHDRTILLSSHILPEIKMTCGRIIIINNGQKVFEETVKNLEEGGSRFSIRVKGNREKVRQLLTSTPGVIGIEEVESLPSDAQGYTRFVVNGQSASIALREEIFFRLAAEKMSIVELRTIGNSLEDVFLESTTLKAIDR
jgi:ABC-2 type transport system ATP-binding protein